MRSHRLSGTWAIISCGTNTLQKPFTNIHNLIKQKCAYIMTLARAKWLNMKHLQFHCPSQIKVYALHTRSMTDIDFYTNNRAQTRVHQHIQVMSGLTKDLRSLQEEVHYYKVLDSFPYKQNKIGYPMSRSFKLSYKRPSSPSSLIPHIQSLLSVFHWLISNRLSSPVVTLPLT